MTTTSTSTAVATTPKVAGGDAPPDTAAAQSHTSGSPPSTDQATVQRMSYNVLANWLGHFVLLASGFILPRVIHEHVGQTLLGVWDFGWSAVAYLSLLNAGIASSVNRYVARYRAIGDFNALNRTVSACACIFVFTALAAAAITVVLVVLLPRILPPALSDIVPTARVLLLLLGLASAVGIFFPVYNGVITGHQRYDLVAYIESGMHVAALLSMIALLLLGFGLQALGLIVLIRALVEGGLKVFFAHRVCPQLRVSPRRVSLTGVREVAAFGGKTFVWQMSGVALYQTLSMLVLAFVGPAALAVYARSASLMHHARKLLFQFARVFTPVASGIQARSDTAAIVHLTKRATRYSFAIALPLVLVFVIMGDLLLLGWMGSSFSNWWLISLLAVGHLGALGQAGAFQILVGLNEHGRLAAATLLAAIVCAAGSVALLSWTDLGIIGPALSLAVTLSLLNWIVVPVIVARSIRVPARVLLGAAIQPLAAVLPFAAVLATTRYLWDGAPTWAFLIGLAVSGAVLGLSYWRFNVPLSIKHQIRARFR